MFTISPQHKQRSHIRLNRSRLVSNVCHMTNMGVVDTQFIQQYPNGVIPNNVNECVPILRVLGYISIANSEIMAQSVAEIDELPRLLNIITQSDANQYTFAWRYIHPTQSTGVKSGLKTTRQALQPDSSRLPLLKVSTFLGPLRVYFISRTGVSYPD